MVVPTKLVVALGASGLAGAAVSAFFFGGLLLDQSGYRGKVGLNDVRVDALCSNGPSASEATFDSEMGGVNARMHAGMRVAPSGNTDHDFARMMIAHHQGAIDMALVQLKYGSDKRLRRLAQAIIVSRGQMCFPSDKRRPAAVRQRVDTTLDADEPAVDIPLQDFRGIRRLYFEVARPRWGLGQCHRARECLLPVRGHDRLPGAAAGRRVADASSVFVDDLGTALGIAPRPPGDRLDQYLDLAGRENREKAEAEKTAKLPDPWITFASTTATGGSHGQPNFVANGGAIDRLQHEVQRKGEFEFADDDGGRLTFAQRHEIAAAHLTLDLEAQLFEEALNRQVEA